MVDRSNVVASDVWKVGNEVVLFRSDADAETLSWWQRRCDSGGRVMYITFKKVRSSEKPLPSANKAAMARQEDDINKTTVDTL